MVTVIIAKSGGERIVLGTDGEKVLKLALECYIDHRATDKNEYVARTLLEHLGGVDVRHVC